MKKLFGLLTVIGMTLALVPAAASANLITVTTLTDENNGSAPCSLREALIVANGTATTGCATGAAGHDDIDFLPSLFAPAGQQEIDLGSFLLLESDVDIQGPGVGELALDGQNATQILYLNNAGISKIFDLAFTRGRLGAVDVADQKGGAIFNDQGNLTLTDVALTDNHVITTVNTLATTAFASGGAISSNGALTLDHVVISGNSAEASNNFNDNNAAQGRGGAIFAEGASLTIKHSILDSNTAKSNDTGPTAGGPQSLGGAVRTDATATNIDHSSFTRNTAEATSTTPRVDSAAGGGGIVANGASTQIELSTIAENKTVTPGFHDAGGLSVFNPVRLYGVTIARNGPSPLTTVVGANIRTGGAGAVTMRNTIVAEPRGTGSENCAGTVTSDEYNIDFDGTPGTTCDATPTTGDQTADPMLAASLGLNGGVTESLLLLPGSPATDKGYNLMGTFAITFTTEDQRTRLRPVDFPGILNGPGSSNGTDIGAIEMQADADADLLEDFRDNCPGAANPGQQNNDGDGLGDACDPDDDNDGVADANDGCPLQANATPTGCPPVPPAATPAAGTGLRAAALKRCAKIKNKKKKKKCKRRARALPV